MFEKYHRRKAIRLMASKVTIEDLRMTWAANPDVSADEISAEVTTAVRGRMSIALMPLEIRRTQKFVITTGTTDLDCRHYIKTYELMEYTLSEIHDLVEKAMSAYLSKDSTQLHKVVLNYGKNEDTEIGFRSWNTSTLIRDTMFEIDNKILSWWKTPAKYDSWCRAHGTGFKIKLKVHRNGTLCGEHYYKFTPVGWF